MLASTLLVTAARTSASVTGVALVVAGVAAGVEVVLEVQLRIRRGFVSSETPPTRQEDSSTSGRVVRANYIATYGSWIKYFRVASVVVVAGALLTAVFAALFG